MTEFAPRGKRGLYGAWQSFTVALGLLAGAGIVADSDPDAEWQETQNKARAVIRAAELAEAGLVPHITVGS